jgi:hypothetical protein
VVSGSVIEGKESNGQVWVAPEYIAQSNIPEVADLLFFPQLVFFLPTGFHPNEGKAVDSIPRNLLARGVDNPPAQLWGLLEGYLSAQEMAVDTASVLAPLKPRVQIAQSVYPRRLEEIEAARHALRKERVRNAFASAPMNNHLYGREAIGHLTYGVGAELGWDAALDYLISLFVDDGRPLVDVATYAVLNRVTMMVNAAPGKVLLYEHRWVPLINLLGANKPGDASANDFWYDFAAYRVFSEIMRPLFGRCDGLEKNQWLSQMIAAQKIAVEALIESAYSVSAELLTLPRDATRAREDLLRLQLGKKFVEPLRELLEPAPLPWRRIMTEAFWDSTFVGGLVAALTSGAAAPAATAAGVTAIAAAGRHMVQRASQPTAATVFLRHGLNATSVDSFEALRQLEGIGLQDIEPPWKQSP